MFFIAKLHSDTQNFTLQCQYVKGSKTMPIPKLIDTKGDYKLYQVEINSQMKMFKMALVSDSGEVKQVSEVYSFKA
jgi:hypothetical protein